MSTEDIIRMAMEAGGTVMSVYSPDLERFAALVAAAENARIVALLDSYESQCSLQVVTMASEGVGNPAAVQAQLDMLRLLREVVQR